MGRLQKAYIVDPTYLNQEIQKRWLAIPFITSLPEMFENIN